VADAVHPAGIASTAAPARASRFSLSPWVQTVVDAFAFWRMRIGFAIVLLIALVALLGGLLAPHSASELVGPPFSGPSADAPLGTDYLGEDVLSRLLLGGRSVVWMSIAAASLALVVGATIGLTAGYTRTRLDDVLMRIMDVLLALPAIILTLTVVSLAGPKPWLIVTAVGLTWVPQIARMTRAVTLEVVRREHIQAVEAFGMSPFRICRGEVLPNIATPLMVDYGVRLTWAIGLIAALSFLGAGIQPPNADWGLMINQNRNGLTLQVWSMLAPVLLIGLYALGVNLMTEGLARSAAGIDRRRRGE
jgi:peptide/nickel transport system permease protein